MTITPISHDDLDSIMDIEHAAFSAPWTRKMFCDELDGNPFASLLAACNQGMIVGHVCFWVIFEELHVMNLAVHVDHRRQGVATAMMTHVIALAAEQGARVAMLEVRTSNTAAIAFYSQMGFEQIAARRAYYSKPTEDAMILRRVGLQSEDNDPLTGDMTRSQQHQVGTS